MISSHQNKPSNSKPTVKKHALFAGLISVFLIGIGFSIITPVVPFLVAPYVESSSSQAVIVTLLTSVYGICMFFSAPILGALSDRFGRRPILIISLLGAAIGFLIFGIGGALWVLFLGRIIEGITGGSISTIFAYFADITPSEERTKYFGWISAVTGVGTVMGPTIGGLIASQFGSAAPLYFAANITFLNVIYAYFFLSESLEKKYRLKQITARRLNPFVQLIEILAVKNLNRLLLAAFLLFVPSGSLQAILSQFTIDTFSLKPALIGLIFSILGVQDIVSQSLIMPRLLRKMSDKQIALFGMAAEASGYILIAISALNGSFWLFICGMFIFGFGDSIFGPSFNGMLSKSAETSEQGRVQGGSQSIQSLARIIGPILGGQVYVLFGHAAPALMGAVLIVCASLVLYRGVQMVKS